MSEAEKRQAEQNMRWRGRTHARYGEYDPPWGASKRLLEVYDAAYRAERREIEEEEQQRREREEEQRRWNNLTPEEQAAELAEKRRKRKLLLYTLLIFAVVGIFRRLIVNFMNGNGLSLAKFE